MVMRCGRDIDNLAAEGVDQRSVLTFGIDDNNICVRAENNVINIALCKERFTAAGYTEYKGVTVKELSAVGDNHIL